MLYDKINDDNINDGNGFSKTHGLQIDSKFVYTCGMVVSLKILPFITLSLCYLRHSCTFEIADDRQLSNSRIFTQYGDELLSANKYFNLTNYFDEIAYFQTAYYCLKKKAFGCIKEMHLEMFYRTRWWMACHSERSPHNRIQDCKYEVKKLHSESSSNGIKYQFSILQYNCSMESTVPCGSTFHAVARTSDELVGCPVTSLHDTYNLTCKFVDPQTKCINLTLLLDYEHYDGYGDDRVHDYEGLRQIVVDDKEFCFDQASKIKVREVKLKKNIRYFTGMWSSIPRSSASSKLLFQYPNHSHMTLYERRGRRQTNLMELVANETFPNLIRGYDAVNNSLKYVFHPEYFVHHKKSAVFKPFSPYDKTKMYHFIGSSHMRHNFEAILEYIFVQSNRTLSELPNHNSGDVDEYNMKSYFDKTFARYLFAEGQAELLREMCDSFFTNQTHTIILQTGAWDLYSFPLRRPIRDPLSGKALMETIETILNGSYPCKTFRHFVWITSLPYPVCHDDKINYRCNHSRGYRTNSAIASLNQYYLERLFSMKIADELSLSIVDAYSIVYPRLMLHPIVESFSTSHILERVGTTILHTPAGDAVVESLLNALSIS